MTAANFAPLMLMFLAGAGVGWVGLVWGLWRVGEE